MRSRNRSFFRLLDAAQLRFRRARPGSVLIMVVSLLVLLALIGTAAMSTSRLDRNSSQQNVKNVQVDLLAEGVKRMVLGVLSKDASAANTVDSTMFDPDATVKDEANAILASLLPERQLTRNVGTGQPDYLTAPGAALPPAGTTPVVFRALSYPPVQTGTQAGFPYRFNDPTESDSPTKPYYFSLPYPKPAMIPTFTTVDNVLYPALQAVNLDGSAMSFFPNADGTPSTTAFRAGERPFIAADTDADGVADAMLVKLPITPISGITYYAAIRVVDNSAKLNLNTAANADAEHATVSVRNAAGVATNVDLSFAGIYPASTMLENLLDQTTKDTRETGNLTEFDKFNGQRVYGQRLWGAGAVPSANPYYFDNTNTPQQRTDFTFLTPGDAMYNNLARMLDYPSISINPNPKGGGAGVFGGGTRPFAIADSMALAYRFTLLNPASQDSIVEKSLFMTSLTARKNATTLITTINKPYPLTAAGIATWFDDNFDYKWKSQIPTDQQNATLWPPEKTQLMRTLLTGFNPVSPSVPKTNVQTDLYRMWYVANYDPVPAGFPNNPPPAVPPAPDAYVPPKIPDATDPIQRQPMAPLAPARGQAMRNPSGSQYPAKANVNTAQFEELWQRYFDVMCNDATSSVFDFGAEDDIYQGSSFNHLTPFGSNVTEHAARMFRSPLRPEIPAPYSPRIARMHPYQVMALRAAIAAANTIALRTDFDPAGSTIINDRNIPFYEIVLPQVNATYDHTTYAGAGANPPPNFYAGVGATVYGVKRQPFITEVFVDNNTEQYPAGTTLPAPTNPDGSPPRNRSGFAAIEIHNPYDRPFRLSGWKLGLVDRRRLNTAGNTVVDWQNQTDTAGNRRAPKMQVVDLPDNTTPDTWDAENPNAAAYAPFIFDQDAIIPPHGFLVVSNLPAVAQFDATVLDAAQYSPADTKIRALTDSANIYTPGGVKLVYARKLHWMANREIQLLRPVERLLTDTAGASKGVWVVRWAPADSFDATGIVHNKFDPANPPPPPPPGTTPGAEAWHYVRSNDPTFNRAWHFVYPGRYEAVVGNLGGHQQGTDRDTWDPTAAGDLGLGHWVTAAPTPSQFGLPDAHNSRDTGRDYPALNSAPVVSTFPIQIANSDFASHFIATGASPGPAFPLNGFARSGDLMQVTYIGSYTVWDADARWTRDDLPAAEQFDAEYWSKAGAENTTSKPPPTLPYLAGGGGRFIEVNPVSMDAAFAEDTDVDDDYKPSTNLAFEDVGRFAPLYFDPNVETTATYSLPFVDLNAYKANGTATNQVINDSFKPDGTQFQNSYPKDFWVGYDCIFVNADQSATATWKVQHRRVTGWDNASNTITLNSALTPPIPNDGKAYAFAVQRVRYEWAAKLPNYFTTQYTPADDYLPNVDPTSGYLPAPLKVKNLSDPSRQINRDGLFMTPQQRAEDDVPAEGLININTANWKVISQLPLVMNTGVTPPVVDQPATEALARRIVYYRDVDDGRGIDPANPANHPPHPHGPFKSLYELCLIPEFVTAMNTIDNTNVVANNPGVFQGDFSPMSLAGDLVRQDFKEKYLALNRISNLVTLKSDSFTVYLQVQGWREAGTAAAKLVAQKRLAFIVDRSQTDKRSPTVYNVPVAE